MKFVIVFLFTLVFGISASNMVRRLITRPQPTIEDGDIRTSQSAQVQYDGTNKMWSEDSTVWVSGPASFSGYELLPDKQTTTIYYCPSGGDCGPNGKDWVPLRTLYWNQSTFDDEGTVYVRTATEP